MAIKERSGTEWVPVSGGGGEAIGVVLAWSGAASNIPVGYLLCDGSAISRTTYSGLFAAIGTTNGAGNGSSTFNLPDLRDKFIVGASSSTGDTTYPGVSPAATGGNADATVIAQHAHTLPALRLNQANNSTVNITLGSGQSYSIGYSNSTMSSMTTGNVSGGSATNGNLPPYYALCYIIKVFDARSSNVTTGPTGPTGAPGGSLNYCNLNKTTLTENINVTFANRVVVRFDNEVSKDSIYTHSNSTNPGRVTVTDSGFFMINATINYDNGGNNRISPRASLFKNGTEISETRASSYSRGTSYGDEKVIQINTVLELAANDYLEVYAWRDQADQNTAANTLVGECEFVLTRISGAAAAPGPAGPTGTTGPAGAQGPPGGAGPTGPSGGLNDASTAHGRLTSDYSKSGTSFETALSVSIDPVQTNSKILVLALGAAKGVYGGSSSGQQANAFVNVTRGNTTVGREYEMSRFGNAPTTFSQAILDTNNHSGNSVTYNLRIKSSSNNRAVSLRDGASLVLIEVTV